MQSIFQPDRFEIERFLGNFQMRIGASMIGQAENESHWECGAAKADITGYVKGIGMMGYGMHFNTVEGIAQRLVARAYVFRDRASGQKLAFVCAETCFISLSVRDGVLKRLSRFHPELGLHEDNVMLTAQHTHSGPGGYSHYGFYNLTIPGFVPKVYQAIVEGITNAIVEAHRKMEPVSLKLTSGEFDPSAEVAFNRSLAAYNRNADVVPLDKSQSHLAVDRKMTLLSAINAEGDTIALINWFGVHTTSISNDNHLVSADNKGFAAEEAEAKLSKPGRECVAAFAQGTAGDVTPNFVWDRKKKWMRGKFEDDFASARHNGHLQAGMALKLEADARQKGITIQGGMSCGLMHADLAHTRCNSKFTGGVEGLATSPACHGISFFEGTAEGPGLPRPAGNIGRLIARGIKALMLATNIFRRKEKARFIRQMYEMQWPKDIIVEAGLRKVLGTHNVKNLIFPGFIDKSLKTFKQHHRRGGLDEKPWVPQILPLQIATLGQIAFVAIPAEISTVGGRRMRSMMLESLASKGIQEVILCPYANAYCGYITTPEEYLEQHYEAGHTVFGRYTLPAFMTHFHLLASSIIERKKPKSDVHPVLFTDAELAPRMHVSETAEHPLAS